jgi:hypothetical protein
VEVYGLIEIGRVSFFRVDLYCSKVESAEPPESAEQRAPANGWCVELRRLENVLTTVVTKGLCLGRYNKIDRVMEGCCGFGGVAGQTDVKVREVWLKEEKKF